MIIAAKLSWVHFFAILQRLLTTYNTGLNGVSLDDTYRSPHFESGGLAVSNGPMEVPFQTAERGCLNAQSILFYVNPEMNLTELFIKANLQTTWTGIILREDKKVFLDATESLPLTRTKYDTIDDSQLVAATFQSDTHGVVLKNTDTTGTAYKFAYVPVPLTSAYRAICLKPIPFPRQEADLRILKFFKQEFHKDIEAEQRSVDLSLRSAGNSLRSLPTLPNNFDLSNVKEAIVYDNKMAEDFQLLESQIPEIIKAMKEVSKSSDIVSIMLRHNNWMQQIQRLEKKLLNPLTNPLILVDDRWVLDIKANTRLQVYKKDDSDNTVILKLEVPEKVQKFPNKPFVPLSSVTDYEDEEISDPETPYRPRKTASTSTTTTTTTTTVRPTPYTITSSTLFTTSTVPTTTAQPSAEGWGEWVHRTWQKVKSFSEFLNMSLSIPSAYDIILLGLFTIHSGILTYILFFKRPRRVVVRKMDWSAIMPKFRRRHSDSSILGSGTRTVPSAPTVFEMQEVRKKKRQIQWEEKQSSSEESSPLQPRSRVHQIEMKPRSPKKPAPPPPYPLYPNIGRNRGREGKIYLPKSLPLYLVESDIE